MSERVGRYFVFFSAQSLHFFEHFKLVYLVSEVLVLNEIQREQVNRLFKQRN